MILMSTSNSVRIISSSARIRDHTLGLQFAKKSLLLHLTVSDLMRIDTLYLMFMSVLRSCKGLSILIEFESYFGIEQSSNKCILLPSLRSLICNWCISVRLIIWLSSWV
jgi:hypothetical protein